VRESKVMRQMSGVEESSHTTSQVMRQMCGTIATDVRCDECAVRWRDDTNFIQQMDDDVFKRYLILDKY